MVGSINGKVTVKYFDAGFNFVSELYSASFGVIETHTHKGHI